MNHATRKQLTTANLFELYAIDVATQSNDWSERMADIAYAELAKRKVIKANATARRHATGKGYKVA